MVVLWLVAVDSCLPVAGVPLAASLVKDMKRVDVAGCQRRVWRAPVYHVPVNHYDVT